MKKKSIYNRIIIAAAAALCAMSMSACGNTIPDLSPEDAQLVGEYSAMLLLKYDAGHRSRLVELEDEQQMQIAAPEAIEDDIPEPETTPEEDDDNQVIIDNTVDSPVDNNIEEAQDGSTGDNNPDIIIVDNTSGEETQPEQLINRTMEEYLGLPDGTVLSYIGYDICDSYSNANDYFVLDPSRGKKFLVVNYLLSNNTGSEQVYDILRSGFVFKVKINSETAVTAAFTGLPDDLSTYYERVQNGAQKETILIFEINESYTVPLYDIQLMISSNDGNYLIEL